ncbi:MAG: GntR family transcriptional regulator [Rhodobacteraceae bacterium]|nr:GntR family transcriptional regulator [Paracoccaceae bacterium]
MVETVYRQVKEKAVGYRFRRGERMNEVEAAQMLSVSRTPVRQALNRLVHEGFMTFVPNRSFYAWEIASAARVSSRKRGLLISSLRSTWLRRIRRSAGPSSTSRRRKAAASSAAVPRPSRSNTASGGSAAAASARRTSSARRSMAPA